VGIVVACAVALAPAPAGAAVVFSEVTCVGDSCQPLPPEPEDPSPGTLVPNPGNPPRHIYEPKEHKKHRKHRHSHRRGSRRHGQGRGAAR